MNTEQFTPGPWEIKFINPKPNLVLYEILSEEYLSWQSNANANLIEAAPDMYEALKKILSMLPIGEKPITDICKCALNKANPDYAKDV